LEPDLEGFQEKQDVLDAFFNVVAPEKPGKRKPAGATGAKKVKVEEKLDAESIR
jgi:hypothetical protein